LRWAVYNCPLIIPSIVNDVHLSKQLSQHILHGILPRRTSIEIECFGSIADSLGYKEYHIEDNTNALIPARTYPGVIKHYNIKDFAIDEKGPFDIDYQEHKISIANYTQLIGLYNILRDMSKYCTLNTKSGSHIHVDLTPTMSLPGYSLEKLKLFLTGKCRNGEIEKIFGPAPKHSQAIKGCGEHAKDHWINLNTKYNTAEFRCGSMTFDYSTIIKWFIGVNKILNRFDYILQKKSNRLSDRRESPKVIGRIALNPIQRVVLPW